MRQKNAVLATTVAATLFSMGAAHGSATEIRLAHTQAADLASEIHTASWVFKNYVNDFSNDLNVRVYADNALGEEREVYEGMQLGSGATCMISGTAILSNFTDRIAVLDLPFLWKDYDHVARVLDGEVGQEIAADLEESGLKVLGYLNSWGYRNVYTADTEVTSPDDLQGLSLRTIPTPVYESAIELMGANPVPMDFGEVYTSMQTGVLDGYEHGASVTKAQGYYEVANYAAITEHLFGPLVFACSQSQWEELSEAQQEMMRAAVKYASDVNRALTPVRDAEAFEFLKEQGMAVNHVDTSVFREAAIPVQDELAAEYNATDLLQIIRDEL